MGRIIEASSVATTIMTQNRASTHRYFSMFVWDRTTRWFHAIDAICILVLAIFGLLLLNEKYFEFSPAGKILLKTLHVYTGYVFVLNLLWRLVWALVGSRRARFSAFLPGDRGFSAELRNYVRGLRKGDPPAYLGHNPLGRLMITALLFLLITQALTGLVLAGTDLYKPPFGGLVAEWVTVGDPDLLRQLEPGSRDFVDADAYDEMRAWRAPFVTMHKFVFYSLMFAVVLHITGVVYTELVERSGLISALVTGRKVLDRQPIDEEPETPSSLSSDEQTDERQTGG